MSVWVWLGVALVLGIIELMSTTFILLWVAIAAVATGILSIPAHSFAAQLIVFVVLSVILLMVTRPLVKRWRQTGITTYRSNVQALEGDEGVVMTRVTADVAGMVRIDGQVWSARAANMADIYERGERVRVLTAKSAFLTVERVSGDVVDTSQ